MPSATNLCHADDADVDGQAALMTAGISVALILSDPLVRSASRAGLLAAPAPRAEPFGKSHPLQPDPGTRPWPRTCARRVELALVRPARARLQLVDLEKTPPDWSRSGRSSTARPGGPRFEHLISVREDNRLSPFAGRQFAMASSWTGADYQRAIFQAHSDLSAWFTLVRDVRLSG